MIEGLPVCDCTNMEVQCTVVLQQEHHLIVKTTAADDLATQEAELSVAMLLT